VPPMLMQPFVENAIWHGLHPKETEAGRLHISFKLQNDLLHCSISDNGVGRNKSTLVSAENGQEKKSMGIKLTQNRLELFEHTLQRDAGSVIVFHDLTDEDGRRSGTEVDLRIPAKMVDSI